MQNSSHPDAGEKDGTAGTFRFGGGAEIWIGRGADNAIPRRRHGRLTPPRKDRCRRQGMAPAGQSQFQRHLGEGTQDQTTSPCQWGYFSGGFDVPAISRGGSATDGCAPGSAGFRSQHLQEVRICSSFDASILHPMRRSDRSCLRRSKPAAGALLRVGLILCGLALAGLTVALFVILKPGMGSVRKLLPSSRPAGSSVVPAPHEPNLGTVLEQKEGVIPAVAGER